MPSSLSQIAAIDWDLIVVGAGPAGALVAHMVAREDKKVLLVEKAIFPRAKVCGCCLNAAAFAALQQAGIEHIVAQNQAIAVDNFCVHDCFQQTSLRIPRGYALSRGVFDAALVQEAIKSGTQFLQGVSATLEQAQSGTVRLALNDGQIQVQCHALVLVVADGIGGRTLASHAEFDFQMQAGSKFGAGVILSGQENLIDEGTIYMAGANHGYVGMVRLPGDQIDVAAALCTSFSRACGGPGKAAEKILRSCHMPVPDNLAGASWHGTDLLTRRRKKIAGQRTFVIGDASGYAEPLTGEGISWALWSALLASPLVIAAIDDWSMELAASWQSIHHHQISKRQSKSKFIASLFGHQLLRTAAIGGLRLMPSLAQPILRNFRHETMLSAFQQLNDTSTGRVRRRRASEEPCPQVF